MDATLYSFSLFMTALYRVVLYAVISIILMLFIDGDKSEIFISIFLFLIGVTVLVWVIDTLIQFLSYVVTRKKFVSEIRESTKHELFVKPNTSNDPDEWLEANLEVFTNNYLDDWLESSDCSKIDFQEQFLTPYGKLVFATAHRNALKQTNFLSWIFHTRSFRKALKKKDFEIGNN